MVKDDRKIVAEWVYAVSELFVYVSMQGLNGCLLTYEPTGARSKAPKDKRPVILSARTEAPRHF